MSHGNQLLHHAQKAVHDIPQPLVSIAQGDKQHVPQFLGLCTWAWTVGCHGGVQAGWKMEAHAINKESTYSGALLEVSQ